MIQVYLAPVGEDREAALVERVRDALADVQLAVDDFDAMKALIRRTIDELRASKARSVRASATRAWPSSTGWKATASCSWAPGSTTILARRRRLRGRGAAVPARGQPGRAARPDPDRAAPGQRAGDPVAPGPRPPAAGRAPGGGQVEPALQGPSPRLHGLCRGAPLRRRRQAVGRGPLRGPVHRRGLRDARPRGAGDPPQGRARAQRGRQGSRRPQRQAAAQHPGDLAARRAVPDLRGRAAVDGHGGAAPLRPAARAAVRPPRPVRPLHLGADVRAARAL
jgi:hypothetical protein